VVAPHSVRAAELLDLCKLFQTRFQRDEALEQARLGNRNEEDVELLGHDGDAATRVT